MRFETRNSPRRKMGWLACVTLGLTLLGCGPSDQADSQPQDSSREAATSQGDPEASRPAIKTARLRPAGSTSSARRDTQALTEADAVAKVSEILTEYADAGPTLVVWMIDTSKASAQLSAATRVAIQGWYEAHDPLPQSLYSLVVGYDEQPRFAVEEPTQDLGAIRTALAELATPNEAPAMTMAACQAVLESCREARLQEGWTTVVVLVSGQVGDDWESADDVAEVSRELAIPIYTIGYPAPFGRRRISSSMRDEGSAEVGPETPGLETIQFVARDTTGYLLDSGFGPWGLERISRSAGGTFLAIRPAAARFQTGNAFDSTWPSDQAIRFDAVALARYAPDYIPLDDYRSNVAKNAAVQALRDVAERFPTLTVLGNPAVQFSADDEAQLKRDLDFAQQPAALLSPRLNQVYELLKDAEAGRATLESPRWQAAYDLALGQALAHVVRVDGYNGMLAQLKTGKSFSNPASDVWVLERADTIDTSSLMRSKLERAQELLQGVIDNHPGTPWAYLAEIELQTPIGYVWNEIDLDK